MEVNLGSAKLKKSFFPNSFDSSTTLNFGECVPQFCKHVVADSHVNISARSGVRLAPLSLPTFGKAYLKSYYFYNRISDIYPPFDNLLTQTPYTSSDGGSYVPNSVPNVPLSLLWAIVLSNSTVSYYDDENNYGLSYSSPVTKFRVSYTPIDDFGDLNLASGLDPAADILFHQRGLSSSDRSFLTGNPGLSTSVLGSNIHVSVPGDDDFVEIGSADFIIPYVESSSLMYFNASSGKYVSQGNGGTKYQHLAIAVRLNDSGKLLRKIFLGLGYKIGNFMKSVSILPLIAFYYDYFDTFAPKRFLQLIDTSVYKVMNRCIQTGMTFTRSFYSPSPDDFSLGSTFIDDLCSCFYTEDTDYYTQQILGQLNSFGSVLSQSYLGWDTGKGNQTSVIVGDPQNSQGSSPAHFNFAASTVSPGTFSSTSHTQNQQNILSRLTEFLNIRSLVGGEIAETLKAVYGLDVKDVLDAHRTYVGSSSVDVEFSDVFSTAETQQGYLGEYAGKAIGFGDNGHLNFDCPVEGFVICFSTIVPRTQYVDGVDPCLFHVEQADFYNPKFDGLTLLPTSVLSLYGHDLVAGYSSANPSKNVDTHSFGNSPIYLEYKTRTQGVLNGDLSLRSTQGSYDSFTMDKVIANEPYSISKQSDGSYSGYIVEGNPVVMSASTSWRYLGRWLWYGRFDRIFVNVRDLPADSFNVVRDGFVVRRSERTDDNLIVHNIVDLKINAPMLPVADSYMTKDLYELENGNGVRAKIQ